MPKQKKTSKSRHHRLPKAHGGQVNYPRNNIILVNDVEHRAFNVLFGGSATVWEVAAKLTRIWVDPRYEIIVRRKQDARSDV